MVFASLEHILTHISFSVVSILISIHLITLLFVKEIIGLSDSSKKGMIITFFCITGLLVTRWVFSGHLPFSDLYESLIFLSWTFSIFYMVPYFKKSKNYYLNTIITPSVIFTQGFATSGLLTKMHESLILVPALQSHWLMMHVSMMILGYATLLCGSLLSVAILVITFQELIQIIGKSKNFYFLNESFSFAEIKYMNMTDKNNVLQKTSFLSYRNYYRSQFLQQLDRWGYRTISLGFIFLTIGIISGAVWANEAWGSYWNWDPKETWAFITWTIFAIYLHTRKNKKLEDLNSSIVASIGFLIIWVCYLGINLLGIGLHSYGSFTPN
ncbi:cytochrome c biogenesis protein (chloroplast) [Glycine max]|uniref:Cytochrome c biogenesis protein CcsA n=6 Tax=indigoferoid/millettioid clade TaxID=2233855 RepID=CCSA_SOYBN|nr:cytochrome c heme attachment protein [Glycine soja var. gracilis]YP_009484918.1 cytochrome c heme attachment protein [Cyamopsis tetragonoloba]YP_010039946.1 cytochrome c heme attachment protein [Mucuna pruriens]YP_538819.1 cytochrome c biogenesis protein [Glycine max]Q2PMN1.1 RecName: Full=Cytochrome c biogenesis protein CcsA [Glycine max]AGM51170.1 cytochrome c heme attachment protein [Glycine soja]ABC25178.1 cytochrome c heme attachment protein [Glycine max]ANG44276.1 cytochrome c heme |eukprot:YP_538819.1 cytochrome c biogenesis protein (chloroplast) [Glycine max]